MTNSSNPRPTKHLKRQIGQCLGLSALWLAGMGAADSLTSGGQAFGQEPTEEPSLLEQLWQGIPSRTTGDPRQNSAPAEMPDGSDLNDSDLDDSDLDDSDLDDSEPNDSETSDSGPESSTVESAPTFNLPSTAGPADTESSETESSEAELSTPEPQAKPAVDSAAAEILQQAASAANQAERMAQTADSAADWDGVMAQWLSAIALAQSIPPESPSRIVAQRQLRRYVQRLQETQQRTELASPSSGLPSFGSDLFDAQLAGYLSYVATVGTPDILIVGSSRALQGIDPEVMQAQLNAQGQADLNVFNFSVNGATAQVVNFVLSELLPAPLPPVIVWGDGSRAFNEGRRDRTWESLLASPGYQAINRTTQPTAQLLTASANTVIAADTVANRITATSPLSEIPANLDALGFSAVSDRFAPHTYYQRFPQVQGRYDGAYSPFTLNGPQADALEQVADFATTQNAQLIFVNLPLSGSYLDADRLYFEGQFQQFLQAQGSAHNFQVIDLLTQWQSQPALFADPSHINQDGAAVIAAQLAQSPMIRAALYSDSDSDSSDSDSDPNSETPVSERPNSQDSITESQGLMPVSEQQTVND